VYLLGVFIGVKVDDVGWLLGRVLVDMCVASCVQQCGVARRQ
jgi:hypothetical protein